MYRQEYFVTALLSLCPTLKPREDFEVTNDGTGPVISAWYRNDVAQPTQAQIEAIDTDALLPPPPPVPNISDRQFFQQLAIQNVISQADALAAVQTGTLPASLVAIINGLPTDQQFSAKMLLTGATTFQRNHPMTSAIGAAFGWTAAQIDTLFIAAAAL